ncbi:helix-turn-helix transcriptional regulator [Flavihumibacter stibioxidans]|uniref:DNA-binding protein n=1 Tax=Flavihumibacter stibioxidans TaxID=1834163 RepID=A0ABR7M5H4_9BACT|nr:YafY family protein [Flavihumibacter stibioxidans]MBC6489774.1 DNA-binding protein [Flavihumibacter stibioxidans]
MNRIDRLTAILIQLQSRRIVKAQDIADRYDISLRTVYRDIRALEESGVPILGEAGVGYSLMEGYRLPPVMFTREEALAFLTAEKLVEKLTDPTNSRNFRSAMDKVRAVLRTTEKDLLEHIDDHIEVLNGHHFQLTNADLNLHQSILRGIAENKVLRLKYFSSYKQEKTERSIEPVGIFYLGSHWHLVAWCRMRKDYRDFRLDRIAGLTITDEVFVPGHPSLKAYLKEYFKEKELTEVVLHVQKEKAAYLGDQKYFNGLVSEKDLGNAIEMVFMAPSLEGMARWYMMICDIAEIRLPAALKSRVKELSRFLGV